MTEFEAIQGLHGLMKGDAEKAHAEADRILLEFLETNGYEKVASAFVSQREYLGFWCA